MATTKAKREFDREVMWPVILKLYPKGKRDDAQSTEKMADALRKKFARVPNENLADCTECGEASPATNEYDACPFCGEGGGVAAPEEKAAEEKAANAVTAPSVTFPAPSEVEAAKMTNAQAKEPAQKEAAMSKPKKSKGEKGAKGEKKAAAKKTKAKGEHVAKVVPVVKDPAKLAKLREELDEEVKAIRGLQKDMLGNGYELGQHLIRVFDRQTWKSRGKYRSFKEWCMTEAGFTPQMAKNYMAASKEYDRSEYLKLGVSKLAVIARLPPADRKPVIKAALEGADLKTVQKKVTERRRELLGGKRGPGRPPKDASANGAAKSGSVSIVVKPSTKDHVLSWYAAKPAASGEPVALKTWEPGAWTFLDLGGGTFLRIGVEEHGATIAGLRIRFERKVQPVDQPQPSA